MKSWKLAIALAVLSLLLAFVLAAAQEPVRSFDQLDTRLKPGDTIWVTDAHGREIKGKFTSLAAEALTIKADGSRTFPAADVRLVQERRDDSLRNGALIGFAIGSVGFGLACVATIDDKDRGWCALVALGDGALGAVVGVVVDALIPGKKLVVYRAPGPSGASHARLSIAPLVTPRAKGLALSFAF